MGCRWWNSGAYGQGLDVRSGGHFAAVPCVNAAWPYREAGVAGCFASPAGGSLLEVPSGLMDVCLGETLVPGASLSRRVALSLRSLRPSWTFALAKPVCRALRSPGGGSLHEVPAALMNVRLFWTQKNPVPGKGRGYTRVTTLILFITNHIQASLGMLCHQQRLCPAILPQGAVITYGLRFGLHTAITITASASLLRGDIRL
ncbi:hypothetical protein BK131_15855 [Paenibacillus amylolyticus]|uniref:Uncharacterized protein n=1 Tax=Paenibacillus amylolyticus TaxID=1451 RepID=A0A1R1BU79_PAEAM|nr:hypothetical protein BK131_15855 [Paenibacillus amylolyticus]